MSLAMSAMSCRWGACGSGSRSETWMNRRRTETRCKMQSECIQSMNVWNYDELYWIMYQRISEIEFKSIKWVAVRAKPGQSLRVSPGLQRRLQFCLPNSTGLPSGKREDAQGSGDWGAWAVGGFRGFMSYQVKIYQDLSRSIKSQIFRFGQCFNCISCFICSLSVCPKAGEPTQSRSFSKTDYLLSLEAMTINYTCRVEEVPAKFAGAIHWFWTTRH